VKTVVVLERIVQQHADEAALLWGLRESAVRDSRYSLADVREIDDRLAAHIEGLGMAGDAAWAVVCSVLESGEPGGAFAAAVLALTFSDSRKLDTVLSAARGSRPAWRALAAALGWVPFVRAEPWLRSMIESGRAEYRLLGVSGYALHRKDPGAGLASAIDDPNPYVRARALRAAGELKRRDLSPSLARHIADPEPIPRFWALWSSALLGSRSVLDGLMAFASGDPYCHDSVRALQLPLRIMDERDTRRWLKQLGQEEATLRAALVGCGVAADPYYVPWLIKHMFVPKHARIAGQSFSMITGTDAKAEGLDTDPPENFGAGPSEDPEDDNVKMDPDEHFAWPDAAKVSRWWESKRVGFAPGVRYLCGKPVSNEHCEAVLKEGLQPQRLAAAVELAILRPDEPLFETRAPAFRQLEILAMRS
jgi:uncharacterized protein (TIGR02270 family)